MRCFPLHHAAPNIEGHCTTRPIKEPYEKIQIGLSWLMSLFWKGGVCRVMAYCIVFYSICVAMYDIKIVSRISRDSNSCTLRIAVCASVILAVCVQCVCETTTRVHMCLHICSQRITCHIISAAISTRYLLEGYSPTNLLKSEVTKSGFHPRRNEDRQIATRCNTMHHAATQRNAR